MNAESKLWQDRHTESKVQMQVQVILNLISWDPCLERKHKS
jgi:hypothetical protein